MCSHDHRASCGNYHHGWNEALQAVARALGGLECSQPTGEVLKVSEVLRSLSLPERVTPPTNADLARKYGVSKRTVLYWKKEGCPFSHGQWHVLDWMAKRRYLPEAAAKRFSKQIQKRKLRADLIALDDRTMEAHALARLHRRLGLPVEPWMRLPRLTRRTVRPLVEQLEKEVVQEIEKVSGP